jgi:hypothetical protein
VPKSLPIHDSIEMEEQQPCVLIRLATLDDFERIREIEILAGEIFRSLNMDLVADNEPPTLSSIREFVEDDRIFVYYSTSKSRIAAYIMFEIWETLPIYIKS